MKDPAVYLVHIVEAMDKIADYIKDAVIRNLEIIGEAAKKIPDEVRDANPSVPWKRLAGLQR